MSAQWFPLVALTLAVAGWAVYLIQIARSTVPAAPLGNIVVQVAALAGAAYGIATAPSALTIPAGGVAMIMSGLFLFLLTQRRTPVGNIRVAVGQPLIPFTAKDAQGANFESSALDGRRILLKFFRGSW